MDNAAIMVLLTEIRDLLRARLPEPAPADPRLEALLRTAVAALDDDPFSAVSLAQTATSSFTGAAALQKAIAAIIGKNSTSGIRKLGRFMARQAGKVAGGRRLVRLKEKDRYGPLYRVQVLQVSNPTNPQASTRVTENRLNLKEFVK